jgi:hypothetical protein
MVANGLQQQQNQPIQWMPKPGGGGNCPPGLEYLTQVDQILVHQVVEIFEMITPFETANRYAIKNSMGQQMYFAFEEGNACLRQCCGPRRSFTMHVVDNQNAEVMRVEREFKPCGGGAGGSCYACCDLTQEVITVEAPPGNLIGSMRQGCSWAPPKYTVLNENEEEVLKIEGPVCMMCPMLCDIDFDVVSVDGEQKVGLIQKQFSGIIKEMYTTADNFGVTFPKDLDAKVKAILLGGVFLIDFMYFEQKQQQGAGQGGMQGGGMY